MIGIVVGLGISLNFNLNTAAYSAEPTISKDAIELLSKTDRAMVEVAAAVKPAVVRILSARTVKTQSIANPFQNDPFFHFIDFLAISSTFLDNLESSSRTVSDQVFIVSKTSYILTNNHVVKDTDEMKIRLSDKREWRESFTQRPTFRDRRGPLPDQRTARGEPTAAQLLVGCVVRRCPVREFRVWHQDSRKLGLLCAL